MSWSACEGTLHTSTRSSFVGPKLAEHRGALTLTYPMERGVVQDWDDMQRVWGFVFDGLGANAKDHPVSSKV